MALTKVSTAMFDTAAQSSDLNIDANTLFVDVSTNRVGIGTTSPSVPLEVSGQLKAGGITYPTSDGTNGQALVTNGSGVASFATVAPTAGTGVTVSGTTVSIGQAVGTSSNVTFNNLVVSGTLTVNGATNTNSATNTTIEDILIELGTGTSGSPANDAGLVLERGSSDNVFIGWDESADTFTVGTGSFTGASSGNLTITPATAVFGGLTVDTSTLVVDASNNRVGIGNASPDVSLDIGSFTDAVHMPVGTTAQRPTGAAGYLRYNSTLNKFEGYTDSWGEIGGGGSNTFTTNVYTGDGSTTAFTLSQSVSDVNDLIVFIDGVYQVPTAAYTVSGTTLTMTAAPANTRKIVAYSVQSAISGTNLNQNSFTGNGSAVAFTLSIAPVNENNTQVFLDGVYQHKSTYATSGTTLTFDTAPASGVAIEVMIFTQTEINVPVDGTITTAKLAADAVTSAKIADDAVGNDQLASGLTLGGNTAATLSTAAQPNITSLGTLTALQVDNININGNTISNTDTNGNIVITANGTGNVNVYTDVFAIQGTEGEYATLALQADEADDAGDGWKLTHNANNNTLSIKNDISGSEVDHMTLTPHATVASSIVSIPGKVGIGETTPLGQLHVKTGDSGATANTSADEFVVEGSANAGISILSGSTSNGSIYFGDSTVNYDGYIAYSQNDRQMTVASAGGGNYIRLDETGHVGFSTTPTAWSSGYKSIQIGARGFVGAHTGSDLYLGQNAYFDSGWKYEASVAASLTQHSGGQITHKVVAAGTANNAISWIDALHITTSGFVGIHDTAPPRSLSITGVDGAYSGQTSGNSRTHLLLENNGSNYIEFLNAESNSAAIFWSNNDGQNQGAIEYKDSHMYLQAHGQANQLVLDSQYGYVHLTGSNDVRLTLSTEGTAGTNSANWIRGNSAGLTCNAKTGEKHMWEIGGTEEMSLNATRLHVNGSVQFSASATDANRYNVYWNSSNGGLIVVSSDQRLKKDFDYDLSGIETIKKLKPVRYTWKENEKRQIGFVAQEAITADEHLAWNDTEKDEWGLSGWEGYVAMLTKAVQELSAEVESLKEKLNG